MSRVFTKVFLPLIAIVVTLSWAVCEYVDSDLLAWNHLETIHVLCCQFGERVSGEFHYRVTLVHSCVEVFGELDGVDLSKCGEPLSDVLLCQRRQLAD